MNQSGHPNRLRRVLIIADDVPRRRRLAGLLRSEGLEPVTAGPLEVADPAIVAGDFAVVVVDERCLDSAAGPAVKALRKQDPELRVVVDTGNGFPGVTAQSIALRHCAPFMTAADSVSLVFCLQRPVRPCDLHRTDR